ncbi:hypothetical protein [Xanthobacter sp. 126]|uniref:hypothetical protein n=1 Tax=Xanthobacter sp. 126 TaxID=1131814 RepID=UPI0018CC0684|nr:hypothetical protein [Xanthobacter sp. 126]
MPGSLYEFVHLRNIRNFEKKIESETDPAVRKVLVRLLAEEKAEQRPSLPPKS